MSSLFTCPSCRSNDSEQAVVRMPSGGLRQTDFFCCRGCRTVFFDPNVFHAGRPAGSASMTPNLKTYGK